jgi:probable HAF family extracellular repeat protein
VINRQPSTVVTIASRRMIGVMIAGAFASGCSPDQAALPTAVGAPSQATAAKSAGTVTTVLLPGGTTSNGTVHGTATAINEAGVVAGVRKVIPDSTNLYLWKDGQFTLYPAGLQPVAINRRVEIAGNTTGTPTPFGIPLEVASNNRAMLWKDGVVTDLGTLGGTLSAATDMNDKGLVVGWSRLEGSTADRAFIWEDGVMTDLGTLGGSSSVAWGINNRGQVVGTSTLANGTPRAFLWEEGTMIDLGVLSGTGTSSAAGINDHGEIVGLSSTSDLVCAPIPFIWRRGVMAAISLPGKSCFSGQFTVRDISDAGHVIGGFNRSGVWRPWIWQDGVSVDLPGAPGDAGVFRVNSSGETVGFSLQSINIGPAVLWSVGRNGP